MREKIVKKLEILTNKISELTEAFYQNQERIGYEKTTVFLEEFLDLVNILAACEIVPDDEIKRVNDILREVLEALENKDIVLVSDILKYDLLERLDSIKYMIN